MTVSQHFIAWICSESVISEYLLQVFRSMLQELDRRATGATVKTIGMPDVRELTMPVPPIAEQRRIVEKIQSSCRELDGLIEEAENAVTLLRERRSALISAAVTGKIDVRQAASGGNE
jgi:type I restriction enzyme S subunit